MTSITHEEKKIYCELLKENAANLEVLTQALSTSNDVVQNGHLLVCLCRTVESLSRSSKALGYRKTESLAKIARGLFNSLAESRDEISDSVIKQLNKFSNTVTQFVVSIEYAGFEGEPDYEDLTTSLHDLRHSMFQHEFGIKEKERWVKKK